MQKIVFILLVYVSAYGSHVTKNEPHRSLCLGLGRKRYAAEAIVGRLVKMRGGNVFILPSIGECDQDDMAADEEGEEVGDVGLPLEQFFSRDEG